MFSFGDTHCGCLPSLQYSGIKWHFTRDPQIFETIYKKHETYQQWSTLGTFFIHRILANKKSGRISSFSTSLSFLWCWATHPLWLVPALQWWRHELHQQGLEEQEEEKQQGCVLALPAMHLEGHTSGQLSALELWMLADVLHPLTPNFVIFFHYKIK